MGLADIPAVSFEDDLTGLYNRRFLQKYLTSQVDWAATQGPPVSFILLDIDEFHRVNDLYGHAEADFVLQAFAERLKKTFRADDVVARDSGDSFFVVLPGLAKEAAAALAGQLVEGMRDNPLRTRRDRFPVELTASAGVVSFPEDGQDADAVRDAADKVLFHAKRSGRNRVSVGGSIDERLAAERDVFAGLPCRTFCGRQQEFRAAVGALEELRAGRPSLLFVQGPAGIGKSRFLREIAEVATARQILYLHAICNESQRQSLGHSLIYLVDQYYRLNPEAHQELHDSLFPAQRRVARELIASLSSWRQEDVEVSPRDRKPLLLGMLETAVLAMTRRSPLLILLDNAKHCDRGTLDVLQRVIRDRRAPVAVFFALKGDVRSLDPRQEPGLHDLVEDLRRSGGMEALTLVPLGRDEVTQMVHAILPNSNAERDFEELLFSKSGGNPLYVEEAIRSLILRDRIKREGDRYAVPKLEPDELPASLDAVIEQVLSTLSPEAGEIVTNASIIGSRFDLQVLQEVTGKREGETLDAVDQVESTKLIEHLERGTADDYAFRSSTARDVRYVTTAEEAKKLMHRRVATIARSGAIHTPQRAQGERVYHMQAAGLPPPTGEEGGEGEPPSRGAAPPAAPPAVVGRPPRVPEGTAALQAESQKRAFDFMRALAALLRIGRLYPQWSQTSAQFNRQLHEATLGMLEEAKTVTFAADAKGLLLNRHTPEGTRALDVQVDFAALLNDRLVASMTLQSGIEPRELDALVGALSAPMNRARTASDHWDQFLDGESMRHVDILQRRYVAREGEGGGTRIMKRETFIERPLTPEEFEELRTALRHFKAAYDNLRLYPPGHALVEESVSDSVRSLGVLAARVKVLALAASDEGLIVNGRPVDARTVGDAGIALAQQLARRELKSLIMVDGLIAEEVQALISIFAAPAEDPSWKDVFKAVVTGNEIRHFEFGGLLYTQLAAASGGVVPTGIVTKASGAPAPMRHDRNTEFRAAAAAPPAHMRGTARIAAPHGPAPAGVPAGPPGGGPALPAGASPGPGGSEPAAEEGFEEGEFFAGVTVRADVRARAYLKAPPERFLSEDFEKEFGPLLEVLNFGWTVQLGAQLVARVAELARDPSPALRERAVQVLTSGLAETASPEARGPVVTKAVEALGPLVLAEVEVPILMRAADAIPLCIGAGFALGRFDAASELLLRVRKRIDAKTAPQDFKTKIAAKLQEMAGPKGPLAAAIKASTGSMREAALKVTGMFGTAMVSVLVDFAVECDDANHRRLAALALKELGAAAELAKLVTADGPAEKISRALSVLEAAGPATLAPVMAAAIAHPDASVPAAAFAMLKRADKALASGGLRRLVSSDQQAIALAAIAAAAELALSDLGLDLTRIAQSSHDEAIVKACCDYLVRVKVPSAIPALRRVFEARAKMFGLVKGFSDETRALAVKAAAGLAHQDAAELLEDAKEDRSPEVRKAAGST